MEEEEESEEKKNTTTTKKIKENKQINGEKQSWGEERWGTRQLEFIYSSSDITANMAKKDVVKKRKKSRIN